MPKKSDYSHVILRFHKTLLYNLNKKNNVITIKEF